MTTLHCPSRAQLEALAPELDLAVARDPEVDPFCARSDWVLPFHDAFAPGRSLRLARAGDSWVLLAERNHPRIGRILEPLENAWGFASPLIGPASSELLAHALEHEPLPVLLLGVPNRARLAPLARVLGPHWGARALEPTVRFVARLDDGLDGWLGGRSSAFRRNLRSATRRVEAAGIEFEHLLPEPAAVPALYDRVLEVEARSWKGGDGRGAGVGPMREFYAAMWPRLARERRLHVIFAQREGRLVGYLHGGLVGRHFRGLQFSYDAAEQRLGLGNVLQLEMLRWLCANGATHYDLGTGSDYKRRWADPGATTQALLIAPR